MEKIAEIYKLFHPAPRSEKGETKESKGEQLRRLRALATTRKQKLLKKGIKV